MPQSATNALREAALEPHAVKKLLSALNLDGGVESDANAKTMLKYCGEVYEGKPQGHGIAEYGPLGAGCSYDGGWLNGNCLPGHRPGACV